MNHARRRKRCPMCHGLRTKKHGFNYHKRMQPDHSRTRFARWICHDCNQSFSDADTIHNFSHAIHAAELYFDAKASYRGAAKVLRIDRMTAYEHIQAVCQRAKMPWELSAELNPAWSGYLAIDGDTCRVFRFKEHLLLAVDIGTRDIPHAILAKHDDAASWITLLTLLKEQLHYPIKGIVSDGDYAIICAVHQVFPGIRHQVCVRHFENEMFRFLRYRQHRVRVDAKLAQIFMHHLHNVLYARNIYDYKWELSKLLEHKPLQHPDLKDAIIKLQSAYQFLTPHFFDRNIPRTNNIAENAISQLDLKINQIVKFQSHETAWMTIKLLISWYRFKKFSGCRKRNCANNGKAPLELAGIVPKNTHWIYQAIRYSLGTQN